MFTPENKKIMVFVLLLGVQPLVAHGQEEVAPKEKIAEKTEEVQKK